MKLPRKSPCLPTIIAMVWAFSRESRSPCDDRFYRTLAQLSREALQAMWDELSEENPLRP